MDRTSGEWTGTGRLDCVDGHTDEAWAEDNRRNRGKNGSQTPDMMSLVVMDGDGTVVFALPLGEWEHGQITRHR